MDINDSSSAYDKVAYCSPLIPNTYPAYMSLGARWHGATQKHGKYDLLELGCGDGANLLALAYYDPYSSFVGLDNSRSQLTLALAATTELNVSNVSFVESDLRNLDSAKLGSCDYVIAHGLYSWVSNDARDAILDLCRGALAPNGVAYVSYNAQPGWAIRRLVRETLLRARSVRDAPVEEKAHRAIEFAAQLLEDLPSRDYASAVLLAGELERVRNGKPGYVFHEYLAETNDGFWLGDFVAAARRHGLEYVCDAQFCRWEGFVSEALRERIALRTTDQVEQEEMADLLVDRYFHASILCQADAPRARTTREELWHEVHIATSLGALSDAFDLSDGVVERFSGTNGTEITLQAAITKAAIVSLCAEWPRGWTFQQLHNRAVELLERYGFAIPENSATQLRDDLTTLFEAGQVDLRLHEPAFESAIPAYPEAHALARFEAAHRNALSTPFHLPIPFEPEAMLFVQQLDGRRSLAELERKFGESVVAGTVPVLARWGLLR